MKQILLAMTLMFTAQVATASGACGWPPRPPWGMKMVCVCDQNGQNCQWITVSK